MFDELTRLRADAHLFTLLEHYAILGAANREAWQDRLMEMDDAEPKELTRLHGEMIAFGWVEQNTGLTPVLKPGVAAACYRATGAGHKALKLARRSREDVDELEAA